MRKLLVLTTVILVALGVTAGPAVAHAVFVGAPNGVPAGSEITLTMNVPHERDDTTFNVDVLIAVPSGWQPLSCATKATWTCAVGTTSGRATVHWVKDAGAPQAEDEAFTFTARAGSEVGTFAFPTVQTYNTQEKVSWIDGPGGGQPAPRLATLASGAQTVTTAPTTTVAHAETPSPAPSAPAAAPTSAAAATTTAPTTTVSTTAPASTTTTAAAPTSTTTSVPAVTTTAGAASTGALATGDGTDDGGDGGGSTGTVVAVVVVLAALAGAGVVAVRRFRPRTPADGG